MAKERSVAERGNDGATGIAGDKAQPTLGGILLSAVMWPLLFAVSVGSKIGNAIMRDGTIAAAGRQGADELGMALKAFPDAIQAQETGSLWSPTQGEIAANRQQHRHTGNYRSYSSLTAPPGSSEVANDNQQQPGKDHGHDNGHEAGHSM